jgi:hypothetical protein
MPVDVERGLLLPLSSIRYDVDVARELRHVRGAKGFVDRIRVERSV